MTDEYCLLGILLIGLVTRCHVTARHNVSSFVNAIACLGALYAMPGVACESSFASESRAPTGRIKGSMCAGKGKHGTFLSEITQFYLNYHKSFYGADKIYVHDPTAFVACIRKDLYTWKQGAVVVATEGALRGKTVMDGAHTP